MISAENLALAMMLLTPCTPNWIDFISPLKDLRCKLLISTQAKCPVRDYIRLEVTAPIALAENALALLKISARWLQLFVTTENLAEELNLDAIELVAQRKENKSYLIFDHISSHKLDASALFYDTNRQSNLAIVLREYLRVRGVVEEIYNDWSLLNESLQAPKSAHYSKNANGPLRNVSWQSRHQSSDS